MNVSIRTINVQDVDEETLYVTIITDEFNGKWVRVTELQNLFGQWPSSSINMSILEYTVYVVPLSLLNSLYDDSALTGVEFERFKHFANAVQSHFRGDY